MTDRISKEERSRIMGRVRSRNTSPERTARSLLHRLGYRFTVNGPKNRLLPGRPDIVLPGRQAVVFVHGCFWHRHPHCSLARAPKSNTAYWEPKLARNVERDQQNQQALRDLGWRVITLWECELKKDLPGVAARLVSALPRAGGEAAPEEMDDELLVAETRSAYGSQRERKKPR